jgi:Ohr subfamily peroxiredoxin
MKLLYQTEAVATGGRDGKAQTKDGSFAVNLAVPTEMGGKGGGNNPEQLFAAGYAACFLGAIRFVAGQSKTKIADDATVTSTVGIGQRDDGTGFGLQVALQVKLPGIERKAAEDLVAKADVVCPYSHATRGNIEVKLSVA